MPKLTGFHTTAEIAQATGLSQNTIRYHCSKGRLSTVAQWTDTEWLIPDAAARAFIAAYTQGRKAK